MTLTEVLVASGVSVALTGGLVALSVTGWRTLDLALGHSADIVTIGDVLTRWPVEITQQGLAVSTTAPSPAWSAGRVTTTSTLSGHQVVTVSWTRPRGTPLSLSIQVDPP